MKKYIYWLTALTVALLAVAMALFLDKTKEIPIDAAQNAQLTPTVVDMGGVDVNSAFSFSFGDKVKASWVRQYLKVEPALEMGFHQGSNNREVLVAPAQPLKADTVYRFTLLAEGKPFHWAFQTKPVLAVKTISPGDKITSVPLNSQITIDFNCSGMMGKKDYFSLEPATEGVFSSSGSQVVFTPQKPLQPDTVYTVKIGKGWPLEDSDLQLQEDYQYSFATASSGNVVDDWSFAEDDLLFAPGEKQFLPIKTYHNIFTGEDIQGEIYAYPDALSFSKALGDKYQSLPSWSQKTGKYIPKNLSGLKKVADFSSSLFSQNNGLAFSLPEGLSVGYYLLKAEYQGVTRYSHLQVSDLKAFVQIGEKENLFWVHDGQSKQPLSNVQIRDYRDEEKGKTDANGLLTLKNKDAQAWQVYLLTKEDKSLVLPVYGQEQLSSAKENQFLQLNHSLYHPNDDLYFHGIIEDLLIKEEEKPLLLDAVLLKADQKREILDRDKIKCQNGIYEGHFSLGALENGYYLLEIYAGDTLQASQYFAVNQSAQAAYDLQIDSEQKIFFSGHEAVFNIRIENQQSLPVADMNFEYTLGDKIQGKAKTDAQGEAIIKISLPEYEYDFADEAKQYLLYQNLTISLSLDQEELVLGQKLLPIMRNNIISLAKISADQNKLALDINTFALSAGDEKSGASAYGLINQKASGEKLTLNLYGLKNKKVKFTDNQDLPAGKSFYHYQQRKVKLQEYHLTADDQGRSSKEITLQSAKNQKYIGYLLEIIAYDDQGRENISTFSYDNQDNRIFSTLQSSQPQGYRKGEDYQCVFLENGAYLPHDAQLLSCFIKDGHWQTKLSKGSYLKGAYQEDMDLTGIYFDGSQYYQAGCSLPVAEEKAQQLALQIIPKEGNPLPGDEIRFSVKLKDQNGKPLAGNLLLYAGDDNPQKAQSLAYLTFLQQNSFADSSLLTEQILDSDLEKQQSAYSSLPIYQDQCFIFKKIKIDADGNGYFSIKLPEDVEKWQLQALVTANNGQMMIKNMSFAVDKTPSTSLLLNNQYCLGDEPQVFLRTDGLPGKEQIQYWARLEGGKDIKEISAESDSDKIGKLFLGPLEKAKYKLTVEAGGDGDYLDALVQEFSVEKYLYRDTVSKTLNFKDQPLVENLPISADENSILIFSSPQRGKILADLWEKSSNDSPELYNILASLAARQLLLEYGGDDFFVLNGLNDGNLALYQAADGGLASLPQDNSDLLLSSLAVTLGSEYFDNGRLKGYFQDILSSESSIQQQAWALAGLASLGEPVLQNINSLLSQRITVEERLYLSWALICAGDEQGAFKNLHFLFDHYGRNQDKGYFYLDGKDRSYEAAYQRNSWAALVSAYCAPPQYYQDIARYLAKLEKSAAPQEAFSLLSVLAQRGILSSLLNDEISFSYTLNGEKNKAELQGNNDLRLLLQPKQGKELKVMDIKGDLQISVLSRGANQKKLGIENGNWLSRSYQKMAGLPSWEEMMKISLDYSLPSDLPAGEYYIVDNLPAGLVYNDFCRLWQQDQQGQGVIALNDRQIALIVNKEKGKTLSGSIDYYGKIISHGQFTAPPASLKDNLNGDLIAFGNQNRINIR